MSARTGVIPRVPMIFALVISAPSQCDRSMSSRPETPGKRYLLPPEKPDDLVREHRADDERDVVLDHGAVDPHVSGVVQHAVGQLGDPVGTDGPDVGESGMIPPRVVEHGHRRIAGGQGAGLVAEVRGQRLLAHRGVSAERDQHGEAADAPVQRLVDRRGQQRHRAAAAAVWHQHAHAAPVQVRGGELVVHERADLVLGEDAVRPADLCYSGGHRTRRLHHVTPHVRWLAFPATRGLPRPARYAHDKTVTANEPEQVLHPDRLLPAEPGERAIARRLYDAVRDLPVISPHGHVDPRLLLDDEPFPDPATLFVTPDHYVTRLLHADGVGLDALGVGQGPLSEQQSRSVWRLLCERWELFRGTPVRFWLEAELAEHLRRHGAPVEADGRRDLRPGGRSASGRTPTARGRCSSASASRSSRPPTTPAPTWRRTPRWPPTRRGRDA